MTKNSTARRYFIDSSAFIAVIDKDDQNHLSAISFFRYLIIEKSLKLITSNLVIAESYTRILYRTYFDSARRFLEMIYSSDIQIIYSDAKIEQATEEILYKYSNLKLSYTDAVSFSIMRKNKIENAFTFDKHFQSVGMKIFPPKTQ